VQHVCFRVAVRTFNPLVDGSIPSRPKTPPFAISSLRYLKKQTGDGTAMGRQGTPEEMPNVVAFRAPRMR
jgi:hypothetical protein